MEQSLQLSLRPALNCGCLSDEAVVASSPPRSKGNPEKLRLLTLIDLDEQRFANQELEYNELRHQLRVTIPSTPGTSTKLAPLGQSLKDTKKRSAAGFDEISVCPKKRKS